MNEFYMDYAKYIIFAHIVSAIVWVGSMIAIKAIVHPVISKFEDSKLKVETNLKITKRLFILVFPFIVISLITAIIMLKYLNIQDSNLKQITHIKEAIWVSMLVIYLLLVVYRLKIKNAFLSKNINLVQTYSKIANNFLLPTNIILGMSALMLGITLRGF